MNRAARRQKQKPAHVVPSWHGAPLKTLLKASRQPVGQAEHAELTLPFLLQLGELKNGTLSVDGFIQLNEMIVTGFNLARDIWLNSPQHSQEAVAPSEPVFTAAAEALAELGARYNLSGKMEATDAEIAALQAASQWHADLIAVATHGMLLSALLKAEAQVRGILAAIPTKPCP